MNYKDTYMWKEISETERAIADFNAVNAKTIAEVVADTEKHGVKNVCLAGRGTSDHALFYFKYLVEIMSEYTAGYVAPSVVTMYDGKVDFAGNLVLGCSQSGYAADVIAVIERAKELAREKGYRGIYVIAQDNNLGACLFYLKCGFRIGGFDTEIYRGTVQEGKSDIIFYLDC